MGLKIEQRKLLDFANTFQPVNCAKEADSLFGRQEVL
jgi:hypothetical protein